MWLPRGCLEDARTLAEAVSNISSEAGRSGIEIVVADERAAGTPVELAFTATLRPEQEAALETVLAHDTGVLVAPPGFGKTVTAAAITTARVTSTLVLVHRKDLQRQWRTRLMTFLGLGPKAIGVLGGGKATLIGQLDVAVVQALVRHDDPGALVAGYGQVIVDECHHEEASSIGARHQTERRRAGRLGNHMRAVFAKATAVKGSPCGKRRLANTYESRASSFVRRASALSRSVVAARRSSACAVVVPRAVASST